MITYKHAFYSSVRQISLSFNFKKPY
jgi:hypothetical protein